MFHQPNSNRSLQESLGFFLCVFPERASQNPTHYRWEILDLTSVPNARAQIASTDSQGPLFPRELFPVEVAVLTSGEEELSQKEAILQGEEAFAQFMLDFCIKNKYLSYKDLWKRVG